MSLREPVMLDQTVYLLDGPGAAVRFGRAVGFVVYFDRADAVHALRYKRQRTTRALRIVEVRITSKDART